MRCTLIVIMAIICMIHGFLSVLFREIGRAFRYAYLEACMEFSAAKRAYAAGQKKQ